jgi:hypothetical protein
MIGSCRANATKNPAKRPFKNEIEKSHERHLGPVLSSEFELRFVFNRTVVSAIIEMPLV